MLKIGNKKIDTNIFLAPLSGCSDLSFRLIAREHGAKFCFFEMIDSHSLFYHRKKTLTLLRTNEKDSPVGAQLLGRDPSIMLDAAEQLLELVKIELLDVNCACPAKKVIKKKAGSYLLKDTDSMCKVVKKLASSVPIPVTVKLRTGFDKKDINDIKLIAKRAESAGAKAIFVHGRTREQGYKGDIDYDSIRAIKESVKIPVIGGGNIFSPELAKKMFTETACDGIFVARGAFGNPWIFKNIEEYIKTGKLPRPVSVKVRIDALKKHLAYVEELKEMQPQSRVNYMRKVVMWYIKGFPLAARMREAACRARRYEDMLELVEKI